MIKSLRSTKQERGEEVNSGNQEDGGRVRRILRASVRELRAIRERALTPHSTLRLDQGMCFLRREAWKAPSYRYFQPSNTQTMLID